MIIIRLELDQFGGLNDYKLDLTDGINVFYGDNGTGKTTLGLFIKTMLYGVSSDRKKTDVTQRMQIIPLSFQTASGRMTIEIGGRRLEIARTFGKTKKQDRLAMTWLDDGTRLDISNEPGEYFLELNEETFTRTCFLGEMSHTVLPTTDGEMTSRLMNLSITGHENMDYHKAHKNLTAEAKALSNQRGSGSLDRLCAEKKDLEAKLHTKDQLLADRDQIELQLERDQVRKLELTQLIQHLKEKSASFDQLKEMEDYERAMLLLAKKSDLEARIERIKSPIDQSEVARIKSDLEVFVDEQAHLEETVSRHNEAANELAQQEGGFTPEYDRLFDPANEKVVRTYLSRKEALEAKIGLVKDCTLSEKADLSTWSEQLANSYRLAKRINELKYWGPVAGLVLFLMLYGISVGSDTLIIIGFMGSIFIALGWFFIRKTALKSQIHYQQGIKEKIRALLGEQAGADFLLMQAQNPEFSLDRALAQWTEEQETLAGEVKKLGLQMEDLGDFLKEQVQYQSQKDHWQQQVSEITKNHGLLEEAAAQLDTRRVTLGNDLLPLDLPCDKSSLSPLERLLNQLEFQTQEIAELDRTMAELTKLSLDRNLNPILLEPKSHNESGVRRELDMQRQLHVELDQANEELATVNIQMVTAKGHLDLLNNHLADKTTLAHRLVETTLQLERAWHRRQVLDLAIDNLEESYREIQRDYLPRVSQEVSQTFQALTKGRYERVLLSGDFKMKIPVAGQLSSMDYLSRGNQDLLWLGLRLSLCAIIVHGEKAPLIFDDSFLHLDEERLKNVLNYLSERIDGQIIILTCHHRETRLLKEMDLL